MFFLNVFQNRSKRLEKVHVVIGHKSCDLDSLISAFTYAYFLDKVRGKKILAFNFNCDVNFKNSHFCFCLLALTVYSKVILIADNLP